MELSDLRYFVNVAVSGSFHRGAALSHVTAPAISKTIKKLEAELGTRLFVRSTRRVVLSTSGTILLARCRKVFEELEGLRRDLDEAESIVRGEVRIAANEVFSLYLLPRALGGLLAEHPELTAATYEMLPSAIERRIGEGLLDVGFTIGGGASPEIAYRSLGRSRGLIVAGRTHPLYRRGRIQKADLARYPFVAPRFFGLEHLPSLDQFPADRWPRKIGATIELLQMGLELTMNGTHLGYFPEVSIRPQLQDGRLRALGGLAEGEPFELRALTRAGAPLLPAARLLIERVAAVLGAVRGSRTRPRG